MRVGVWSVSWRDPDAALLEFFQAFDMHTAVERLCDWKSNRSRSRVEQSLDLFSTSQVALVRVGLITVLPPGSMQRHSSIPHVRTLHSDSVPEA